MMNDIQVIKARIEKLNREKGNFEKNRMYKEAEEIATNLLYLNIWLIEMRVKEISKRFEGTSKAFKEIQKAFESFKVSCEFVLYAQHKPTCFACGEFNKEINQCEICEKSYCEKHSSSFSIHNKIDFNCCEECQINKKEEN